MLRAAKVDKNQPKIVKALRAAGAKVVPTHQLKNAFDILVAFRGELFVMEIKNPEYLPKVYDEDRLIKSLSSGELECLNTFASVDVKYHIVATAEEALNVIYKKKFKHCFNKTLKYK